MLDCEVTSAWHAAGGAQALLSHSLLLAGDLPWSQWLPRLHSGCLQVVKGADVVLIIERSKTDKNDKPFEDIKIMNISVNTTEAA